MRREPQDIGAESQARLVAGLLNPSAYDHPVERVETLETHISYVLLAGAYAYKIKKAVDLGFLDFTTLPARHFYCLEELRLNRRLAPDLYLEVIPITSSAGYPVIGGQGTPIEYTVKMRRFSQDALLDRVVARDALSPTHVDAIAAKVAQFHASIPVAGVEQPYGAPTTVYEPTLANIRQLEQLLANAPDLAILNEHRHWVEQQHAQLADVIAARKRDGFVRECHGDLHLGNIALIDGVPTIFDCLEFSEALRWIDVMNETAFLVMDLEAADRPQLAWRFLNDYLERTGDYAGLAVLRYYAAYRAMVRALVSLLRSRQLAPRLAVESPIEDGRRRYSQLAHAYAKPVCPALVITHGFSGSGKTFLTQSLVELTGAIRVRSDVERKRLLSVLADKSPTKDVGSGLYAPDATVSTYQRLLDLARVIVGSGHIAVVDATFLTRWQRDLFRDLAATKTMPYAIVDVTASVEIMRQRIIDRLAQRTDPSDADLAVIEHQLAHHDPLAPDELDRVITIDSVEAAAKGSQVWQTLLRRLSAPRLAK